MYTILNPNTFKARYGENFSPLSPFDAGIPLVEASDDVIEKIYYFRWHTFCSHIKKTPVGYVVTEFSKDVPWAGIYNTIVCGTGHHLLEGRWLPNHEYLSDYAKFWFTVPEAKTRLYSCWIASAVYAVCKTWGDFTLAKELYETLKTHFLGQKKDLQADNGLYYQYDVQDGMELSISGHGYRPTINSYQYADAMALSKIALLLGKSEEARSFLQEAANIKELVDLRLWDERAQFYKTISDIKLSNNMSVGIAKDQFHEHINGDHFRLSDVREQIGFVPWYFGLPDEDKSIAWKFLMDENHFAAPYGITTAEQCHPKFMSPHRHECLWNGPVWPFATSQTLTALGNLLADYKQDLLCRHDYFILLKQYADSQHLDGKPFVDEDLDPFTGVWLAREKLLTREDPHTVRDRGIHYNHSTFCDLVLTGLAGVRARDDHILEIDPMFSEDDLSYFCADGISYHGHNITVLWDRDGRRYQEGIGLHVFCDGKKLGSSATLRKRTYSL